MSPSSYAVRWLGAFVLTQAVEAPIYSYGMRGKIHLALAASAITHPIVWFVLPHLMKVGVSYLVYVLIAEAFAVGVEAVFLHKVAKLKWAWAWALGANASSVALGFTVRHFFGWP